MSMKEISSGSRGGQKEHKRCPRCIPPGDQETLTRKNEMTTRVDRVVRKKEGKGIRLGRNHCEYRTVLNERIETSRFPGRKIGFSHQDLAPIRGQTSPSPDWPSDHQ